MRVKSLKTQPSSIFWMAPVRSSEARSLAEGEPPGQGIAEGIGRGLEDTDGHVLSGRVDLKAYATSVKTRQRFSFLMRRPDFVHRPRRGEQGQAGVGDEAQPGHVRRVDTLQPRLVERCGG